MGGDGTWTIVNTGRATIVATLHLELTAFHVARGMDVRLDGGAVQSLRVDTPRRVYELGPMIVSPGRHQLVFHPAEEPTVASEVIDNRDGRRLSFAIGSWQWSVQGAQP